LKEVDFDFVPVETSPYECLLDQFGNLSWRYLNFAAFQLAAGAFGELSEGEIQLSR